MEAVEAHRRDHAASREHVLAACDQRAAGVLEAVRHDLEQSRGNRAHAATAGSESRSRVIQRSADRLNAIIRDLESALSCEGGRQLTLKDCRYSRPEYYSLFSRHTPEPKLDVSWTAQEEEPGEQHVSVLQVLPLGDGSASADGDDNPRGPPPCDVSPQLALDISADEALILAQPIVQVLITHAWQDPAQRHCCCWMQV